MKRHLGDIIFLAALLGGMRGLSSSCSFLSEEDTTVITDMDTNLELFRLEIARLNDNLEALAREQPELLVRDLEERLQELNSNMQNLKNLTQQVEKLNIFLNANEEAIRSIAEFIDEANNPYGYEDEEESND